MESIRVTVMFVLVLIMFLESAIAMNKEENTPTPVNDIATEDIEKKPQPVLYDSTRGQLLYENHCLTCHESQMHIRAKTKVKQISELRFFVLIRSNELNLQWGDDEREAVTQYLNNRFYNLSE